MSRQHENTITTKLVDILNRMRSTWSLEEQIRPFQNNQKCPDVFVTELGREPVAVELLMFQSACDFVHKISFLQ